MTADPCLCDRSRRSLTRLATGVALGIVIVLAMTGCGPRPDEDGPPVQKPAVKVSQLVVAFEAPVEGKGLLDSLVSAFATAYPQFSVEGATGDNAGTVAMGEKKTADVLIVRARGAIEQFNAAGLGVEPSPVFHTDYVIVGPVVDPARVKGSPTGAEALARIARRERPFYSQGAASTAYPREASVWASASVEPSGTEWYRPAGQDASETLRAAATVGGYALVERVTWFKNAPSLPGLAVLVEGTEDLLDRFVVVQVAEARNPEGAKAFSDWIRGPMGRAVVAAYGVETLGGQVFKPAAP